MTEVIRLSTGVPSGNRSPLWPTTTTGALSDIIENCRLTGQLGLITGPSGIGKTTAAKAAILAAHEATTAAINKPTIVYVSMIKAADGLQPGLLRIAAALEIVGASNMPAYDVHDALVRHEWQPCSLIVLDEAQYMSDALLHAVRNLWDELSQACFGVGIVLIGTPDLAARISSTGRKAIPLEALRGRLGATSELKRLEPDDCTAICRHLGLTDKKSQDIIKNAANRAGGLHNVRRLVAQAQAAAGEGKRIFLADLQKAAELAGVGA